MAHWGPLEALRRLAAGKTQGGVGSPHERSHADVDGRHVTGRCERCAGIRRRVARADDSDGDGVDVWGRSVDSYRHQG